MFIKEDSNMLASLRHRAGGGGGGFLGFFEKGVLRLREC